MANFAVYDPNQQRVVLDTFPFRRASIKPA